MTITGQRLDKRIPEGTLSTIEGHSVLVNGPINMHSWQQKMVFCVRSALRNYNMAQPGKLKEYEGIQWNAKAYEGVQRSSGVQFSWKLEWSVQSEKDDSVSDSDLWTVVTSCIKVQ
jgi:hypothetical protein